MAAQTESDFRAELLRDIYRCHYAFVEDNFDFIRFGADANPRTVYYDDHSAYLDYVLNNLPSFFAASLLFSDSGSRELFKRLITFRCVGSPHLRIFEDLTWTSVRENFQSVERYEVGPSSLPLQTMFGPLIHYENVPAEGRTIALDVPKGYPSAGTGQGHFHQYYFKRDGVSIRPDSGDWIIDGGACFGDTGVFFACSVGPEGRVYSFDPLPAHVRVIDHNIEQNGLTDTMFSVPRGLADQTNEGPEVDPSLTDYNSPAFSLLGGATVPIITIDDFAAQQQLAKLDFIKLDIEGFELATLHGATRSIERFRPKLAISLYHKRQDFFEIPIYLKTHHPYYRFYLDHHTIFQEETVLYAVSD